MAREELGELFILHNRDEIFYTRYYTRGRFDILWKIVDNSLSFLNHESSYTVYHPGERLALTLRYPSTDDSLQTCFNLQ